MVKVTKGIEGGNQKQQDYVQCSGRDAEGRLREG